MKWRINEAEAVTEAFWDPELSQLAQWTFTPANNSDALVRQEWDCIKFEWNQKEPGYSVFSFGRSWNLECGPDFINNGPGAYSQSIHPSC